MPVALVTGASGAIGHFLLPRLLGAGYEVIALSRVERAGDDARLQWRVGDLDHAMPELPALDFVASCGPLDAFSRWFARTPVRTARVVAFSSMSIESKHDSADAVERALAGRLRAAEELVVATAQAHACQWTVLRPTLIYGAALDRSLTPLAHFAQRWRVFPRIAAARGLRQPVHADDVAQAVLAALPTPYIPLPQDPGQLRALAMRDRSGQFGFSALLDLCWVHGIPVIPLPHLPVGVRKMDGAALQLGGRPAIVIAKKKSSRAWLSFILAHEIGHIALGHLRPGSSIIDVSLQETTTYATGLSADDQEAEADRFALQTLGGEEVTSHVTKWPVLAAPVDIAVLARSAAGAVGIEAGHFVLRYAFLTKRWPTALTALNFLSEDLDPESALLQQLRAHLDLSRVADDLQDLVSQITGWDGAN